MECRRILAYFFTLVFPLVDTLNFYNIGKGNEPSYASYNTDNWNILKDPKASLEFHFKTNRKQGILLHMFTRNMNTDSIVLHIEIHDGILKTCFGSICKYDDDTQFHKASLGSKWNDMEWHRVRVERFNDEIFISIDDFDSIITVGENNEADLPDTSQPLLLHIGGTQETIGSEIRFGDFGFTGCIKNISYPIGRQRWFEWKREDVGSFCLDTTCFKQTDKSCLHIKDGALCQNGKRTCSCGSFFTPNCPDSSKSSVYLNENAVIRDQIDASFLNSRINTIELVFRTHHPQGTILYNRKSSSYIILQLFDGGIRLTWSLGAGDIDIRAGKQLHDGRWHKVTVKRTGKKVVLHVDGIYNTKEFLHYPVKSCLSSPELVYIGGYTNPPVDEKNFQGCLREVYIYNDVVRAEGEYDYIEIAKSLQDYGSERSKVLGVISLKCPLQERREPVLDLITDFISEEPNVPKNASRQNLNARSKLSENTVAWITAGICIGSLTMIITLACGLHFMRKKYSGHFNTKKVDRAAAQQFMNSSNLLSDSNTFSGMLKGPAPV